MYILYSFLENSLEYPKEWKTMKQGENLEVVQISSGNPEYSGVIDKFHTKIGKKEIIKVRYVKQNTLVT